MITRSRCRVAIAAITGLLCARLSAGQSEPPSRCARGVHESQSVGVALLPEDRLFCHLVADPKEARTFVSFLRGTFPSVGDPRGRGTNIGSVGIGDSLGIVRWGGPAPGEGLQLDVVGSIFAQFDLGTSSNDLINADYIIGVPVSFVRAGTSARVTFYHQSSHLGDEYLLRPQDVERENLSFESVEALIAQELGPLRVYGGAEWLVRRDPDTLASRVYHAGAELRSRGGRSTKLVGGLDVKVRDRDDRSAAFSARIGLELTRAAAGGHPARPIMLMLEAYDGPSPYGQFFQDDVSFVGVGLHFGL